MGGVNFPRRNSSPEKMIFDNAKGVSLKNDAYQNCKI